MVAPDSSGFVSIQSPKNFFPGDWIVLIKRDATKASYRIGKCDLSVSDRALNADALTIVGTQSKGFVRIASKLDLQGYLNSDPVAAAVVLKAGDEFACSVDSVELVRRDKTGKIIGVVSTIASNLDVPPTFRGVDIPLSVRDAIDIKDCIVDLLKAGVDDFLTLEFVLRAEAFDISLALPTLVFASDIQSGKHVHGVKVTEIGKISEFRPRAAVPAAAPSATTAAPVESAISGRDLKSIEREIGNLERALWGGYSSVAAASLTAAANSALTHPDARARAAWELARWFSIKGDFARVVELLAIARAASRQFARRKTFRLVEVNALLMSGDLEQAARRAEDAVSSKPTDNDYALMAANVAYYRGQADPSIHRETMAERLAIFNAMFGRAGLAPLDLDLSRAPLSIESLRCEASDRYVEDGPKVSVLMAAYGAEEHLHIAVSSILKQTWRNLELIIVEDCSPDGTWDEMQRFAAMDSRVRIFRNSENQGAYITRNVALSHAVGDYITVHDSDDWSHPEMLARQMRPLLQQEGVKATFSMMCRVTPDLRFGIRPSRKNLEIVHRSYPSLLVRREMVEAVGVWDGVRANADAEMVSRLRNMFGAESLVEVLTDTPLSFFLVRPESLTEQGETSLLSLTFGVRREYDLQAAYMAKKWADAGITPGARINKKVPFASPQNLLPYHMRPAPVYDLAIVSDLSLLGGTRGCNLGYIDAAVAEGKRVALFHWPRGDLRLLPDIDAAYRDRNQHPLVDVITCEEEITCDLLIVHHPPVLKHMLDKIPRIHPNCGILLVNQLPYQVLGGQNVFYEPLLVQRDFRRLFGVTPLWAPISDLVRRHLADQDSGLAMTDINWLPPINMPIGEARRRDPAPRQPVIGRHARDHWSKWPENPATLRAAYMVDSDIRGRFLGGAATPLRILGRQPDNWEVLEFDSEPVVDFIDSLDFLVHVPHSQYIEEFGRNVAEAMARGVPVVLPPVFRETFGDAAIYAEPDDIGAALLAVWNDSVAYEDYSRRGLRFVAENCHASGLFKRLAGFLSSTPGDIRPSRAVGQ